MKKLELYKGKSKDNSTDTLSMQGIHLLFITSAKIMIQRFMHISTNMKVALGTANRRR